MPGTSGLYSAGPGISLAETNASSNILGTEGTGSPQLGQVCAVAGVLLHSADTP